MEVIQNQKAKSKDKQSLFLAFAQNQILEVVFIFWALFIFGSYVFFLLQRGISKWSSWQF